MTVRGNSLRCSTKYTPCLLYTSHLPKNIRQIGECKGSRKIYMEDYVYTFLRRMEEKNRETGRAGILLGRYNWMDGVSYLFIKSALEIENMEVSPEHISFTDQVWTEIHDTVQQYFKEQEILGWFLNLPEYSMEINEVILRAHLNHFGGNDKVLFLIEPTEKEEAFFSYDSSRLKRESGFYVYYEKNVEMQNYMIDKNKDESVDDQKEVPDKAVKDFRKLTTKKLEEKEKRSSHSLLYGVTACVAAVSYTHLDVYKRQSRRSACSVRWKRARRSWRKKNSPHRPEAGRWK